MKKISQWARHHKAAARIIIIGSFVVLTVLGILVGVLLDNMGVTISSVTLALTVCAYITAVIAYPAKFLKGKKLNAGSFYVRQKTCDFVLAASTFLMIIYFSNQPGQLFNYSSPLNAAIPVNTSLPKDSTVKTHKPIAAFAASLKDETGKKLKWKERKKLLREQVRAIRKSDMSNGGKVALIILSVFVAIGLLGLILALACDLSCSGSEGAAILVGVGGTVLISLLLVLAIRAITGKKRRRQKGTRID